MKLCKIMLTIWIARSVVQKLVLIIGDEFVINVKWSQTRPSENVKKTKRIHTKSITKIRFKIKINQWTILEPHKIELIFFQTFFLTSYRPTYKDHDRALSRFSAVQRNKLSNREIRHQKVANDFKKIRSMELMHENKLVQTRKFAIIVFFHATLNSHWRGCSM